MRSKRKILSEKLLVKSIDDSSWKIEASVLCLLMLRLYSEVVTQYISIADAEIKVEKMESRVLEETKKRFPNRDKDGHWIGKANAF